MSINQELNVTTVNSKHHLYIKYVVTFGMICSQNISFHSNQEGGHFHNMYKLWGVISERLRWIGELIWKSSELSPNGQPFFKGFSMTTYNVLGM